MHRYWSPYYEIETTPIVLNGRTIGSNITVNKDSPHQQALDLSQHPATDPYIAGRARLYDLPYAFATPERVLIVGAGTGNDTAAALRNAPDASIDAVEIDPVIARLGSSLHPERPYDSSAVNVIINNARSFLQKSDEPYDLIVFGFLDSHRLFSQMSSVRMDNYIYAGENFRRVRDRLTEDGVVTVTFTIHEKWIANRIFTVMTNAFGHPPLVYQGDANGWGTTFLIGREPLTVPAGATVIDPATAETEVFADRSRITWRYSETEGYLDAALFSDRAELLTDDWPFLYMRSRTIPPNYLLALILTFLGSLLLVWRMVPSIDMKRPSNWNFFALGAAFALLEQRTITEDRAGVRVHLADQHDRDRRHPHHDPLGQPGCVAVASSAPMGLCGAVRRGAHRLRPPAPATVGPELRGAGARRRAHRSTAPMFFAHHSARWFEKTDTPSAALGANLIGAAPRRPAARVPLPRDRPATALPALGAPSSLRPRSEQQSRRGARHRPSTNSSRPPDRLSRAASRPLRSARRSRPCVHVAGCPRSAPKSRHKGTTDASWRSGVRRPLGARLKAHPEKEDAMSTPTVPDSPPSSAVGTTPSDAAGRSTRSIRVLSILVIIAGAIFIVAGVVTWFVVRDQLADEKIVVSDDAERFAGWESTDPSPPTQKPTPSKGTLSSRVAARPTPNSTARTRLARPS